MPEGATEGIQLNNAVGVPAKPDFLAREILGAHNDDQEIRARIEAVSIKDPLLNVGLVLARQEIAKLANQVGVVDVAPNMQIGVLPDGVYRQFAKESADSGGVYGAGEKHVLVRHIDGQPRYIQAASALHELVHAVIDREVYAVSDPNKPLDPKANIRNLKRVGLKVLHNAKDENGKVELNVEARGDLLNELGNFIFQADLANQLLERSEFAKEKEEREGFLRRYEITPGPGESVEITFNEEGEEHAHHIEEKNIHFDKDGKIIIQGLLYVQLAADLAYLCDELIQEGQPGFRELILLAKSDPAKQSGLKALIDKAMGEGFYGQLKQAAYDNASAHKLLALVQGKVYRGGEDGA